MSIQKLSSQFGLINEADSADPFVSYLENAGAILREFKQSGYAMLRLRPGDQVLDVGSGIGDDARSLAAIVGKQGGVCGVDSSLAMIDEARSRTPSGLPIEFKVGEVEN